MMVVVIKTGPFMNMMMMPMRMMVMIKNEDGEEGVTLDVDILRVDATEFVRLQTDCLGIEIFLPFPWSVRWLGTERS